MQGHGCYAWQQRRRYQGILGGSGHSNAWKSLLDALAGLEMASGQTPPETGIGLSE